MTPSRENIELSVARSTLSIFMTMAGAVYLLDWISPGMAGAHEIYRCSTLGVALVDALEELINDQELSDKMAMQVLAQFDTSMGTLLGNNLRNKGTIKGSLRTYRFLDDVWTFDVRNGVITQDGEHIPFSKAKIIACNAKRPETK